LNNGIENYRKVEISENFRIKRNGKKDLWGENRGVLFLKYSELIFLVFSS
jgi:hypothetical protein